MPLRRNQSLHTFTMSEAFAHEDEGTAVASASTVVCVMEHAKSKFPGIVTTHQLARSLDKILSERSFEKEGTLLATSLSCDEVCRDLEDELREKFGQNYSFGGIGGFPFGGCTAFGAMCKHIPVGGNGLIVYGSHVGIDHDGVIGKVNRRGHCGSGACCNTSIASLAYVKAVKEGSTIHMPDPSDPVDAQQVFVDSAMLKHSDRLLGAEDPMLELPHAMFDCQTDLFKRIMDKCIKDIPAGAKVAILGGVQVNTPEGTPDYFLPKRFNLHDSKGNVVENMLEELIKEGHVDLTALLKQKKLDKMMAKAQEGLLNVQMIP